MAKIPCGIIFDGKRYTPEQFMAKLMDKSMDEYVLPKAKKVQSGEYKTTTEKTVMPDGEEGVIATIEKPNGEKVVLEAMYPEDVQAAVDKKIRGFKLGETEKTKPQEQQATEATIAVDEQIFFDHAGSEKTGKVVGVNDKGQYEVVDSKGVKFTVSPENARTKQAVESAKQSIEDNLKKIDSLIKKGGNKESKPDVTQNTVVPKDAITAPFKALGFADSLVAYFTSKVENAVANAARWGMGNSNAIISRAASELQGLFKQLALTEKDIELRRKGLGKINSATLKALKFYENAVNSVGKEAESLRNVHQVLDPEVYTKRGETPITYDQLSPAEKNLYDLLRATNDMIHDWHFVNGRISQQVYEKNKGSYTPRFYRENEFGELPNDIKASFDEYAKLQNFSYIKERQAFEDVMNENTIFEDPVYGTSMRLAQMLRNQALMDYADMIYAKEKTYNEGDKNIPSAYVKLEGGGQFGNINTYGKLTNKYVPRDIAEDFKGTIFINHFINEVYKLTAKYDRLQIRQILKKTKTIYNPITQLGNIGSNYVFAMMNGIDPLTFQARKFEAAKEVKEKGDLYLKLVEEGILGTDITTKDLKEAAGGKPASEKSKVRKVLSDIDDKISEFYGSRDDIAKVAAFLAHTKDYGRSESDALKRVSEGFQNYNNVGRFYDFGSKLPIIGNPFIKFKGDLLRIMKNNFSQRPLTNIALLAALNLLADQFSKWADEDETVKEIRERRKFIPKVPLPNALGGDIPLTWQTPYGEINAARYFSPMNVYDMGDKTSTLEEISQYLPIPMTGAYEAPVSTPAISDPLLGPFVQVLFLDKDFRGKPILDPEKNKWRAGNATTQEKIMNGLTFIARQDIPFFAGADDMLRAYNGEPDYYQRNRDLKQAIISNFIKMEQFGKPEAKANLEKEVENLLKSMDRINDKISQANSLARKNIERIAARNISYTEKQVAAKKEMDRANNKIAELIEQQVEIKKKLVEPYSLAEKLSKVK